MDGNVPHEQLTEKAARISMLRARMPSRSLQDAVMVLEADKRGRANQFPPRISAVFREFGMAFAGHGSRAEDLLYEMNVPPAENEAVDDRRAGWAELSYDIFSLNPDLSVGFTTRLLRRCVAVPAHWVLSLSHSESISILVGNNVTSVDFSTIRIPRQCEDSRALYGLAALRWHPAWEEVGGLVFDFLFSKRAPIQNSAYWVLRARATLDDLKRFCCEAKVSFPSAVPGTLDTRSALDAFRKYQPRQNLPRFPSP
jgi:hypothetical protein